MQTIQTIQTEVMLLSWAETSNGGAKIVLQLPDPSELEPFKAMTLAKGKIAGQRLAAVFVPISDTEEPAPAHESLGPLATLAVRWCRDKRFLAWAGVQWPHSGDPSSRYLTQEQARALILDVCKIGSRKDLDKVPSARDIFLREFRGPYMEHLEGVE